MVSIRLLILATATHLKEAYTRRWGPMRSDQATVRWQGYSTAGWVRGDLQVVTTRLRPAYLRKNGVPYSDQTRVEEHFDRFTEPNGDNWLVVDSIVSDPVYLTGPYITSVAFKKIPDKQGWDPTPCRANEAR